MIFAEISINNYDEFIKKIEKILIESKSYMYIRLLASKIKLADTEKLEQAILDSNDSEEIKKFAKAVKKSKIKKFLLVI